MKIPKIVQRISKQVSAAGGEAVIVGGAVRDHFLGLSCKDYDIEVYGLETLGELEAILAKFGRVNLVGKSFGVLKFVYEGEVYDFSFPRFESKSGKGHRDFTVEVDGTMSFRSAAKRRDFTMNAMGYAIEKQCFLDPFGGRNDMKKGQLRHVDDNTFAEDPLRVYRAVQFAGRFGYRLEEETASQCREMVSAGMLKSLAKERVYMEIQKLLLKAPKPSLGFEVMRELGILCYFPELEALTGVAQDPKWHPEGDVWVHTMMALDVMAILCRSECPSLDDRSQEEKRTLKFLFAILCHDFGKPATTTVEADGRIRAIGHEKAGLAPTESFMYRLTDEHDFIASLLPLVAHHLKPSQFYAQGAKAPAIRRLASKVNIEALVLVAKADFLGRTTPEAREGVYKAGEWLLTKAADLHVKEKALDNLLQGRDLIALGVKPSPRFKDILHDVYERQLDGSLTTKEEALLYVKTSLL